MTEAGVTEVVRTRTALRVQLLGRLRVWVDGRCVDPEVWRRRKALALVKILAISADRRMHRDRLLEVLWPGFGPDEGVNNLHHELHAARHALQPDLARRGRPRFLYWEGPVLVLADRGELETDVDDFMRAAAQANRTDSAAAYAAALSYCTGPLLPEDLYEEWTIEEREAVNARRLSLLAGLAHAHAREGNEAAAADAMEQYDALRRELGHTGDAGVAGRPASARRAAARVRLKEILAALADRRLHPERARTLLAEGRGLIEGL